MYRYSVIGWSLFAIAVAALASPSSAKDKSRVPPLSTYQAMLDGNKESGWVSFRNYGDNQWIYFSALQTLHCRLNEIRYSINSEELDKTFDLVECNPQNPFAMPPDFGTEDVAITLPLGTAETIAVQVVWEDGSASAIAVYEPCENVGDQTCAWPLK